MGSLIALPLMPSLAPARAEEAAARRLLVWFTPNGHYMSEYRPVAGASGLVLPRITEPLAPHLSDLTFVNGVRCVGADLGGIDPHGTAVGTVLTGIPVDPNLDLAANNGPSFDQLVAQHLGASTRLPSLDLTSELPPVCRILAEDLQPEVPCAYVSNISWRGPGQTVPRLYSTRSAFEALFGDAGNPASAGVRARRLTYRKSVLDTVLSDLAGVRSDLDQADRAVLEQYLTSLREVEQSLSDVPSLGTSCSTSTEALRDRLLEEDSETTAHVAAMTDLMVLALQCDQTRVVTYMMGNGASNRPFPWLDIPEAHHALSHHAGEPLAIEKIIEISRWEMETFANLVQRLAEVPSGDHRLLDDTVVLNLCAMGDGNMHDYEDLPIILAGSAGGRIPTDRNLTYDASPRSNALLVSLMSALDVPVSSIGAYDDGPLPGLLA